jgi:hypothetical protein
MGVREEQKIAELLASIKAGETVVMHPCKGEILVTLVGSLLCSIFCFLISFKSVPCLLMGIGFLYVTISEFLTYFTNNGLLELDSEGITCFGSFSSKRYDWSEITNVTSRWISIFNFTDLVLKSKGRTVQIGRVYNYKELYQASLIVLINRLLSLHLRVVEAV